MIESISAIVVDGALCAPMPGWFRCTIATGRLVAAGDVIGELNVLGRNRFVIAPNVRGLAQRGEETGERRAVSYGDVLVHIVASDPVRIAAGHVASAPPAAGQGQAQTAATQHVFRAPTSGRFFARPSPGKPPFVSAGSELTPGCTVCLLEVMKTFHRVAYAGEPARVRSVLVAEGDEVTAGAALLELEAP